MTLKYPFELNESYTDYVIFTAHEFATNASVQKKGGNIGPPVGDPIVLYMPPTTPSMANPNGWGAAEFAGPLGALRRDVVTEIGSAINESSFKDFQSAEGAKALAQSHIERLKNVVASAGDKAEGAIKQGAISAVAGAANLKPNQLLALSSGQIYNPNIELLYEGPTLRGFNFQYTFAPKSAEEAAMVNELIKQFKIHSSPEDTQNGMYKVPRVFQVKYMVGSSPNPNMNEFKRAALTNIQVQANPGLSSYAAFENGMPILTGLSMSFTEMDVITRGDHETSISTIGF